MKYPTNLLINRLENLLPLDSIKFHISDDLSIIYVIDILAKDQVLISTQARHILHHAKYRQLTITVSPHIPEIINIFYGIKNDFFPYLAEKYCFLPCPIGDGKYNLDYNRVRLSVIPTSSTIEVIEMFSNDRTDSIIAENLLANMTNEYKSIITDR